MLILMKLQSNNAIQCASDLIWNPAFVTRCLSLTLGFQCYCFYMILEENSMKYSYFNFIKYPWNILISIAPQQFFSVSDQRTDLAIQDLYGFKDPRPDCNIQTFFTQLPMIILFLLLLFFNNRFFISLRCVLCILNVWQKRGSIDEQTCRDFLKEHFEGNFGLLFY